MDIACFDMIKISYCHVVTGDNRQCNYDAVLTLLEIRLEVTGFSHVSDRVEVGLSVVLEQIFANLCRHVQPLCGILRDSIKQRKDAVCLYNRRKQVISVVQQMLLVPLLNEKTSSDGRS